MNNSTQFKYSKSLNKSRGVYFLSKVFKKASIQDQRLIETGVYLLAYERGSLATPKLISNGFVVNDALILQRYQGPPRLQDNLDTLRRRRAGTGCRTPLSYSLCVYLELASSGLLASSLRSSDSLHLERYVVTPACHCKHVDTRKRASFTCKPRPGFNLRPASNRDRRLFISIRTWFISLKQTNFKMESLSSTTLSFSSVIRGHHVYKPIWTPYVGEELVLATEHHSLILALRLS